MTLRQSEQPDWEAEALEIAGFCSQCGEEAHAGGDDAFHARDVDLVALMTRGQIPTRRRLGPVHVVTDFTIGGRIGNPITRCGLEFIRDRTIFALTLTRIDPNGRHPVCGDCFGDASITFTEPFDP